MIKKVKITDLMPLLKPGYVAMDSTGQWYWYKKKPKPGIVQAVWIIDKSTDPKHDIQALSIAFNIKKSDKEWNKSAIKVTRK